MRSRHIPMSLEEFELLPTELGWKCEYWDNKAFITPWHHIVVTTVRVEPRDVSSPCLLRSAEPDDAERLFEAYIAAFSDSIEYCDYTQEKIEKAARQSLESHFAGERGEPMPVSCVAVDPQTESSEEKLVGAALIVRLEKGPLLDLLLVAPPWQRRGLGTAMVSAAVNELHQLGEKSLTSRYHIGNEGSLSWHQKFGFIEEPDLTRARLYCIRARRELWRRDRMGDLTPEERERLGDEARYWIMEVERLERIEQEQGYEAVNPLRHW